MAPAYRNEDRRQTDAEAARVREPAAETIFALSSASGRAGIAVVRISGPRAAQALEALAGGLPEPRHAHLAPLRNPVTGEALDQAIVLWFPAPRSFTGEDVAEFHIHGGRAVVQGVVQALGELNGFRPAEAGEFARRAFENGKLDLTEIEGLADLINADTEAQRRQALRQTEGALGVLYERWRAELVAALASIEAGLDFSDEADVPGEVSARARPVVDRLATEISTHLDDGHRGERLRDGYRVLLAGPPNAGKSSLLNALARRDAAIVSEAPGTTRDVIEVHLDLGGSPVLVMDTAGIREALSAIEREGVARAFARAEDADLILWLVDATAPQWEVPAELKNAGGELVMVLNKIDLARPGSPDNIEMQVIELSAENGEEIERLTLAIQSLAADGMGESEAPALTRTRHRLELETALAALARYRSGPAEELELRAEDLREAVQALGRVTGRVDVEDILDRIFGEFCIGK